MMSWTPLAFDIISCLLFCARFFFYLPSSKTIYSFYLIRISQSIKWLYFVRERRISNNTSLSIKTHLSILQIEYSIDWKRRERVVVRRAVSSKEAIGEARKREVVRKRVVALRIYLIFSSRELTNNLNIS